MEKSGFTQHTLSKGCLLKGGTYDYRIEDVLGQGQFGITYMASVCMSGGSGTLDAGARVVIKEFFMRGFNGRSGTGVTSGDVDGAFCDYKRNFRRKALCLAHLQHTDIVKVTGLFEANSTVYYVMEYIDGVSLNRYVGDHGPLKESEAVGICTKIGSALAFMHSKGMLHLDLKPSNIMMRKDGTPVLIDFGLSRQYDKSGEPESSTNVGSGTPGYAPIEQTCCHDGSGFPVTMDVYALGATMFNMLTGQRPPDASSILNDGFPYALLKNLGVSMNVVKAVAWAMNAETGGRCASVNDFLSVINGVSEAALPDMEGRMSPKYDARDVKVGEHEKKGLVKSALYTPAYFRGFLIWAAEIIFALWMLLYFSREVDSDNGSMFFMALYFISGAGVLYWLIGNAGNIKLSTWKSVKRKVTGLCVLNSCLLPIWNGSLTGAFFMLSFVLSVISAYMFSVRDD